jgi:hypothetical protein
MKQTKIKAGYRATIKSWENDGDNSKTVILEGLSEERIKFIVELGHLFKTSNHGNQYDPSDGQIAHMVNAIRKVMSQHVSALDKEEKRYATWPDDVFFYLVRELIGDSSEGFFLRAFDSMKIEFLPEEVVFNDVTTKFIKNS